MYETYEKTHNPCPITGVQTDFGGKGFSLGEQEPTANDPQCNSIDEELKELLNFNPREINFSDIQQLWYQKDSVEILGRVALVTPIVLLGIIGNFTIIYSMCRFKPFRTKPTNIFILNMAIADLLTTMVVPTTALFKDIYQFYALGPIVCRFEGFIKISCLLVKSYSLIVLSCDWLLCVVKPCRKRITIQQSWITLIVIWTMAVLMATPLFIWRELRERVWKDIVEIWCCEMLHHTKYYWVTLNFFLVYLPTLLTTIVLGSILVQMDKYEATLRKSSINLSQNNSTLTISIKYRRHIVKILVTYLLTSFICWTPLQFTIIYRHFRTNPVIAPWFFELNFFAEVSASLSAALDPIIFGFLSQPFRRLVSKFVVVFN